MNFDTSIISTVYAAINTVCNKYDYQNRFPYRERQDLASDILEYILSIQDKYDSTIGPEDAWVYKIAKNRTIDFLKKRFPKAGSRVKSIRLEGIDDYASRLNATKKIDDPYLMFNDTLQELDYDNSYESVLAREEFLRGLSEQARMVMESLPQIDRDILTLKSLDYHSDRIAAELGLSVTNVNVRYKRLKSKIQRIIEKNSLHSSIDM